jgi:predicted negative regulator of RcsB-dependent stress response
MRQLLIALVIGVIAWQAWGAYQRRHADENRADLSEASETTQSLDQEAASDRRSPYQCDGRVYCSQMTSCEEAEFFLANCPGVKMDGGGDGVPCEKQWCGDR